MLHNVDSLTGDHDPSGLDKVRDIRARLARLERFGTYVSVNPIALTMEQI